MDSETERMIMESGFIPTDQYHKWLDSLQPKHKDALDEYYRELHNQVNTDEVMF